MQCNLLPFERSSARGASLLVCAIVAALAVSTTTACEPAPLPEDEFYVGGSPLAQCIPNNDGVITQDEMPFVADAKARIRVGEGPLEVDVDGTEEDGVTV